MNRYILGAVLTALVLSASAARADEWSKTYSISGRADLTVQTDDGDVQVVPTNQKQIIAQVETEGYKIGPDDVRIVESQSGDHVVVTVKTPHDNFNLFGGIHRSVHVHLTVPSDLDLSVSTGDGGVTLQPVSGHIKVHTGDGSIHADGLRGDLTLGTGDGSIEAHSLDGTLSAHSGDGGMNITGRFDGMDINTGDGSINAEADAGSKMTSPWSLHSGDGSIDLHLPHDLSAFVDLRTGDGSISLGNVPVTVEGSIERSHVRGNLNGGGGELKVTSGDGSIHLMRS